MSHKPSDGVQRCRSCTAPIWWKRNPSGKYQPMDLDLTTNTRTEMPHHATCRMAAHWRNRGQAKRAGQPAPNLNLPW